jgi:uncharacterized protein (TIGR02996 family)
VASVLAIVSKAVFEKVAGKSPKLGTKLRMDRYVSANKGLTPLGQGGKLYLVTVRPPDEQLWLVAVLDAPAFDGAQWLATPCDTPLADITALRGRLEFESGKGITAAAGALGMSLQTPRVLTDADCTLLDAAAGGSPASGPPSVRAGLFAAVIADPDSDGPRQVIADELSLAGDPRGEFIHLDLALAGPLSIRKRDQLKARRDELFAMHAKRWWPYKLEFRTHRGFIEAITASLGKIPSELFELEPVVGVTVTGVEDAGAAAQLAKAPWLGRLQRLIVRGAIGDDGFGMLCKSNDLDNLQALNVTANKLTWRALIHLPYRFLKLRTLVLTGNWKIGDPAGLGLLHTLPELDTLYISGCGITDEGVERLVEVPLPKLAKLCLSKNRLSDRAVAVLAAHADNLPALRFVELRQTGLGMGFVTVREQQELIERLIGAIPGLRLDLRDNFKPRKDQQGLFGPRVRLA